MIKQEVDNAQRLRDWLASPRPVSFQGLDLRPYEEAMRGAVLRGCCFLGCALPMPVLQAAMHAGCLVVPEWPELPFQAVRNALYSPEELYDQFDPADPGASYGRCLDRRIYVSYIDPVTKAVRPVDLEVELYRRLHDGSISDTLEEVLDAKRRMQTVAVMGGHKVRRDHPYYKDIAHLARELQGKGYTIITGGGPGLMEAANLGAYTAGFADAEGALTRALGELAVVPSFNTTTWLASGYQAKRNLGTPQEPERSRNFGIPTWFYGHEPANFFATDVAKYFENSVREEGLLAIAQAGVIFGPGAGGTTQEIFQDACQNYYRTYGQKRSPMVLYPADYWAPPLSHNRHDPMDASKPAYQLLEKLAVEGGFSDYILCTNATAVIPRFLESRTAG